MYLLFQRESGLRVAAWRYAGQGKCSNSHVLRDPGSSIFLPTPPTSQVCGPHSHAPRMAMHPPALVTVEGGRGEG